jgi:hypothetical protein
MALIFDPMGDLAEVVSRIEGVLLFTDPDSEVDDAKLDAGTLAAGSLAIALREAAASTSLSSAN